MPILFMDYRLSSAVNQAHNISEHLVVVVCCITLYKLIDGYYMYKLGFDESG